MAPDARDDDRPIIVPMNNDQVWGFDVARSLYVRDRLGLVILWIWTIGFLLIGILAGRPLSLLVGIVSSFYALPWTIGRVRSARAWRGDDTKR